MIMAAKVNVHLKVLVPRLVDEQPTGLQYADDTMIFLDPSEQLVVTINVVLV
jgi:hypothetical protein